MQLYSVSEVKIIGLAYLGPGRSYNEVSARTGFSSEGSSGPMVIGFWFHKAARRRASVSFWLWHRSFPQLLATQLSHGRLTHGSLFLQSQRERVSQQEYLSILGDIIRSDIVTFAIFSWLGATHWSQPRSDWGTHTRVWTLGGRAHVHHAWPGLTRCVRRLWSYKHLTACVSCPGLFPRKP